VKCEPVRQTVEGKLKSQRARIKLNVQKATGKSDVKIGFVFCLLPFAFCILPFAFCILHFAFCILPFAFCLLTFDF
jgi:hypothetical protein